jgi:hypothetical protein
MGKQLSADRTLAGTFRTLLDEVFPKPNKK